MYDPVLRTIAAYDAVAAEYARINECNFVQKDLDFFVENLAGKSVLDAGCGHGRDARFFSDAGLEVTGIDLSERLLKIAVAKAPKAKFLIMDMRQLTFPDRNFDGIWSCASFLHIPKKSAGQALEEFRRVLKPAGLLYVSVKEGDGERFVKAPEYGQEERFYTFYSREDIVRLVESAGFELFAESGDSNPGKKVSWINVFAKALK
jgi:ubiquinone/menaquinone biosynthesis C-methylase UbiE